MPLHPRTVGAMHRAHMAWAQFDSLSIGRSEILNLLAHKPGGSILDMPRADEALNTWFVFMIILPGVGALTLNRQGVQRVLISIAFVWLVAGALLPGYRGHRL